MGARNEYGVVPGSRLERALAVLARPERRMLLGLMSARKGRTGKRQRRLKFQLERRLAEKGIVL